MEGEHRDQLAACPGLHPSFARLRDNVRVVTAQLLRHLPHDCPVQLPLPWERRLPRRPLHGRAVRWVSAVPHCPLRPRLHVLLSYHLRGDVRDLHVRPARPRPQRLRRCVRPS
eukprot:2379771-Pleurochrysis_carterae.AAC.1